MAWHGLSWHSMAYHGMEWHDMAWNIMAWHGMGQWITYHDKSYLSSIHGMVCYAKPLCQHALLTKKGHGMDIWHGTTWHDMAWQEMARHGLA